MSQSKKGKEPNNEAQSPQPEKNECTDLLVVPKLPDRRRAVIRMNTFVREYERQCGNISSTCAITGVSRRTYYRWMNGNAAVHRRFQRKIFRILPGERLADAAEAVILHHLHEKDLTAAIFTAKTQGRSRGWNERVDINTNPIEADSSNVQLMQLRGAINKRAAVKGTTFHEELRNYLDLCGDDIPAALRDPLISELEQ